MPNGVDENDEIWVNTCIVWGNNSTNFDFAFSMGVNT